MAKFNETPSDSFPKALSPGGPRRSSYPGGIPWPLSMRMTIFCGGACSHLFEKLAEDDCFSVSIYCEQEALEYTLVVLHCHAVAAKVNQRGAIDRGRTDEGLEKGPQFIAWTIQRSRHPELPFLQQIRNVLRIQSHCRNHVLAGILAASNY